MDIALQERVLENQSRVCAVVREDGAAAGRASHDPYYIY